MKSTATLLMMTLLATGCANIPSDPDISSDPDIPAATPTVDQPAGTVQQDSNTMRKRRVPSRDWRVDCSSDEITLLTHCKAETYSKITGPGKEDSHQPASILWISWLTGEPKHARSVCVFGNDFPVTDVILQIDDNESFQLGAHAAAGCVIADSNLINQLRAGKELAVTFQRWPWGQTRVSFNLNRSAYILKKLDRLVAKHWSRWMLHGK